MWISVFETLVLVARALVCRLLAPQLGLQLLNHAIRIVDDRKAEGLVGHGIHGGGRAGAHSHTSC